MCVLVCCLHPFSDLCDIVICLRQVGARLVGSINVAHLGRTDHFCRIIVLKQKTEEETGGIRDYILPGNAA